ncbi:hypothetical protein RV11_GL000594 [Enterococcus phoeniculicola]|jgi:putative ABC transport system permease protein|uniref:Bacteriocin-associated integral membrane protein n=1 Tax=Enterococcus phoeniculicola ATCC BAA-412 TaxID=1158610 RepID=R3W670_9ENTE|nr:hypothetical protein [Enterococcus phoeniculicola]EOL43191.1 hypothetical protein UC3_02168 [Enterococcus phoeniculicola ATCC BAA-412]EOT76451.1 hypothetical protein I589_01408 [Enterococcus phoeniculicola ATCC BAA-412]OJG71069.1 hypothetical protein RV11_GL000594 [Enterococcus phoeniculicola]
MKKLCYSASGLLFFICFLAVGELFIWNIATFDRSYYHVTFYHQSYDEKEMYNEIENEANNNNLEVFMVNRDIRSTFDEVVTIYSNKNVFNRVSNENEFTTGTFESLFLGKVTVENKKIINIPENSDITTFQLIGKKKNMIRFKKKLVNKYAGSFPKKSGETNQSTKNVLLYWTLALAFIFLLTIYKVALLKKEILLRMVQGESLQAIIYKSMVEDICSYTVLFLVTFFVSNYFTHAVFRIKYVLFYLVIFMLINTFIYFSLLRVDLKKDISNNHSTKKLLNVSYLYKIGSLFIFLLILSSAMPMVKDGFQFYSQRFFFKEHSKYKYVQINPTGIAKSIEDSLINGSTSLDSFNQIQEDEIALEKKFISNYSNAQSSMYSLVNIGYLDSNTIIYANKATTDYIEKRIPNIAPIKKEKMYLLIPNKLKSKFKIIKQNLGYILNQIPKESLQIQYYQKDIDILSVSTTEKITSECSLNPIMLVNTTSSIPKEFMNYSFLFRSSFHLIPTNEWNHFVNSNAGLLDKKNSYVMGIYQWYLQEWSVKKRTLLLGTIIILITALMEVSMMSFLVVLEQKVKAQELMLKELLGYNFLERYFFSLVLPIFCGGTALIIGYYTLPMFNTSLSLDSIIATLLFTFLEEILFIYLSKKHSKQSMMRVLKGGIL